ncbi:VanZ family protein [Streptomyces sp. NPDC051976]|uniref:VanZ family protein n=1 Tax=Streptomyces sp. NPDC051976 TaxID=3154947 RepID=UPI003441C484
MAVRAARLRAALTGRPTPEPTVKPKPTTKAQAKPKPKPKPKAKAADTKAKPKPKPRPKPKADAKPRSRTGTTIKARTTKPKPRPRAAPAPEPVPAPARESEPVLQRRTWGSTLARAAVLAVAFVCMVGFAVALAKATLVPSPASDDLIHTNLRPGDSIRTYLDQPALRDTVKQIGGNILLGVPFGILLPMLFPKFRGLLRVAGVTALVMVMVETAQGLLVEGRAFDIDDVILNTLGALIGYVLLGLRLGRALHPRREHWWHRFQKSP